MTKLAEIERAIEALPPEEYNLLRAWFEEREAKRVDDWLEREVNAGKFDEMAKEALKEFAEGRARDL
jgi:hypothetical protein